MKKTLFGLTMLGLLSLGQHAQGQSFSSTGGGNGGQTIYRGDNAYLRDLVEKDNCSWRTYEQILKEAPSLGAILAKMSSLNPSFTYRINEEVGNLGYCFTPKRLPLLQYNNSDDLHIFANQEYDQVAINDSGIVFIDTNIFKRMDNDNKSYLFLHEAAHELFNKQEKRSAREPRLREFLMNLFEQLNGLAASRNSKGFDYIISKARFTALESVNTIDHEAFETIFLNAPEVDLSTKVQALKKLYYSPLSPDVYSPTLKRNIRQIEDDRVAKVEALLARTNFRTTKENFKVLVQSYKTISPYIYKDDEKLEPLKTAIIYSLQAYDLSSDSATLEAVLPLVNIEKTSVFFSGFIAKNYESIYGEGTFSTKLLKNEAYLKMAMFGQNYSYRTQQSWNQLFEYEIVTYTITSMSRLENKASGAIFDQSGTEELPKYLMAELKVNRILRDAVVKLVKADLEFLKSSSVSLYTLPDQMQVGSVLGKAKGRKGLVYSEEARFTGASLQKQISEREALLKSLN